MLVQLNLQSHFGGGEVYTAFLCMGLSTLGIPTRLVVNRRATFWSDLGLPPDTELVPVADLTAAGDAIGDESIWLLGHGPLPTTLCQRMHDRGGLATAIAHMPVQGRDPAAFAGHDRVFAVSGWVLAGLRDSGLPAWEEPLYGVAQLRRTAGQDPVRRTSRYDWDRRKVRDRLLARIEPMVERFRSHPLYERRPGLTLGIVSRLTPIKQFPQLFGLIGPVIARHPSVNLEIFGSGGYASVRDLSHALQPIADRVRFWGHQNDVASVYGGIDYLLTGLPEKEALGLNVIEAQACGVPVIAPDAPPFTETVVNGVTGHLYRDPRIDDGLDFDQLLTRLRTLERPLDPRLASEHMARFSFDAFVERLRPVVDWARSETGR